MTSAEQAALADAIGAAILDATPRGDELALVARTAQAEAAVRQLLQQSVAAARAGGHSWAAIGERLGLSRQAVQQRFGERPDTAALPDEQRWLGPVTAFDEMGELELAGRLGWHTVQAGMLRHLVVRTPTQWEHKRVVWTGSLKRYEKDGWVVGARAFPWIYLVRDTGLPAES
ncbi:AsnC family protein [Nocardioides sp. cx-169]|uniref:AsnC family protein n=1 Tax=Nocardioides sp. cx-169 TaxID=2899080 RepID=UPI001E6133FB|nr:AsnC family protein [Nocardioides sp. cx-169]MCD4532485.1 AsnC family protein [Nocardioides sp. cx-169]